MAASLPALGPSGPYRTTRTAVLTAVTGAELGTLAQVPPLYVRRAVDALRAATPLSTPECLDALREAATLFAEGVVDGVPVAEHEASVAALSGVALPVVRAATQALAHTLRSAGRVVAAARPHGITQRWQAGAGRAVWVRRGEVLGVLAPGNHPGTHGPWLTALALGYRVAVRPSARDPLTPARLVSALRACGFGDQVAFLPCAHEVADELVRAADLALVYGGAELAARYGGRTDVLVQGPGRSKVLVSTSDWVPHLDVLVDSVAGFGATACVNASAVLVDGDAASVAEALAAALARLPVHPAGHEQAVLPVFPEARARELEEFLRTRLDGARLLADGPLTEVLPDGGAVLRPAVVLLDRAADPRLGLELPFPCVWLAPWRPAEGTGPLRESLVVTALTADRELLARLAAEPTIRNLHIGAHPTHLMDPVLPHDGHLAEFLMRAKTVIGALAAPAEGE
ncbi:acyl-CoA reductase-like NAD-dependent aldehyde dehydrogenase [Crossiella equi]|uniref:Acyl-CoA reductase-like NAD-dependent aldehyde dehydrogenase n=1 Tax=Crossiella equi TaxID=130796 RepID=A0ABS5A6R0_9PSEU|nr:aldehyde dehydrogenase family protein [Crossiella equi]MBP2472241.1 acyl-CoA reductase-like NAD-dependent aldehyde dehydrogenase [Crossiella equi]